MKKVVVFSVLCLFLLSGCDGDVVNCIHKSSVIEFKKSGEFISLPYNEDPDAKLLYLQEGKDSVYGLYTIGRFHEVVSVYELVFWRILEFDKETLEFKREVPGIDYSRPASSIYFSVEQNADGEEFFFLYIGDSETGRYALVYDSSHNLVVESVRISLSLYEKNFDYYGSFSSAISLVDSNHFLYRVYYGVGLSDYYKFTLGSTAVSPLYLVNMTTGDSKEIEINSLNFDYENGFLYSENGDVINEYSLDVESGDLIVNRKISGVGIVESAEVDDYGNLYEHSDFIHVRNGKAIFTELRLNKHYSLCFLFFYPYLEEYYKYIEVVDLTTGKTEARISKFAKVAIAGGVPGPYYLEGFWDASQTYYYSPDKIVTGAGMIYEVK